MGAKVHFSQNNAEETNFDDGSFDLIISTAIFHKTSDAAIPKILKEVHRLLRPGGITVNMEVPCRYWEGDIFDRIDAEWEMHFNNESAFRAAVAADYPQIFADLGFAAWNAG